MPDYVIVIAVLVLVFGLKAFREVKDFLIKKEQLKADASVRAEALRLKNEIELEKLLQNDKGNTEAQQASNAGDRKEDSRRNNDRLRY